MQNVETVSGNFDGYWQVLAFFFILGLPLALVTLLVTAVWHRMERLLPDKPLLSQGNLDEALLDIPELPADSKAALLAELAKREIFRKSLLRIRKVSRIVALVATAGIASIFVAGALVDKHPDPMGWLFGGTFFFFVLITPVLVFLLFIKVLVYFLRENLRSKLIHVIPERMGLHYDPETREETLPFSFAGATGAFISDIISGQGSGLSFRFFTMSLYAQAIVQSAGAGQTAANVPLVGSSSTVLEISFARPFPVKVDIYKNLGEIGNTIRREATARTRIDSGYSSFDKLYEVYSTSPVEALALLTPDVLEVFVDIGHKDHIGSALRRISFAGDKLYMIFDGEDALLPIDLDKPLTDPEHVRAFTISLAVVQKIASSIGLRPYRSV